jgi:hypothetical protein
MPTLLLNRYCFLALSYSILEAARHPSIGGGCAASTDEQQNAMTVAAITADDHAPAAPLLCVMKSDAREGNSLSGLAQQIILASWLCYHQWCKRVAFGA